MSLEKLFNPRSIAIVGASEEEGKVGNVICKNILNLGYSGNVFLVNPKYDHLFSKKCHHSLSEIEEEVDLAVFAIPAKAVAEEIRKNSDRIKNYVVISAGFSEIGEDGRKREEDLLSLAEQKELNILGPNCLGFIIPGIKLNASFAGGLPPEGSAAFVSQSGALAVAMMDRAKKESLGFSGIFSVGNKMSIGESELLDHLSRDGKTKAIGMYLEGIKDGELFLKTAGEVSGEKPVVILKAGKTEKTQQAISSHTGALSGSDEIVSAAFEKAGVLRARDLEDFLDLLDFVSKNNPPENSRIAVVTNAGGAGVLIADAFKDKAVKLWEPSEEDQAEIKSFLSEESSAKNPIDVLGDAKADRYRKSLEWIERSAKVGSVIVMLTPQDQTPNEEIAQVVIDFKKRTKKIVTAVFIGGERISEATQKMKTAGVCVFGFPERAVEVIDKYYSWGTGKNSLSSKKISFELDKKRRGAVLEILEKAGRDGRKALSFSEASEVMKFYGIDSIGCVEIFPGEDFSGKTGYPAVLKVDSDRVLHKTDRGGLVLGIENRENLLEEIIKMREKFPGEKLIVQPMVRRDLEIILGIKRDPIFGPVVLYGLGGIYTEIFKMVDFVLPPEGDDLIKRKLLKGKLKFLFEGARGKKPYDVDEIASVIRKVGEFSLEAPEVSEFDINPMLFYNNGEKGLAVDIKIIF